VLIVCAQIIRPLLRFITRANVSFTFIGRSTFLSPVRFLQHGAQIVCRMYFTENCNIKLILYPLLLHYHTLMWSIDESARCHGRVHTAYNQTCAVEPVQAAIWLLGLVDSMKSVFMRSSLSAAVNACLLLLVLYFRIFH